MKDIILAGIQASGKWTQSQQLLVHFWSLLKYFETGGILRSLQSSDNAIGNYLKDLTANGHLVKDEVVSGLFGVYLETLDIWDVVLADWCLRRMGQTQAIIQQLMQRQRDFVVIELMIPEDEVYTRLAHRMICANCGAAHNTDLHWDITTCTACGWSLYRRNDDADLNAIKNRVSAYYQDTVPALAWIKEQWHLVQIDGTQSIEKIFAEILSIIS